MRNMNTYNKLEPEEDENGYDNLCRYSIEKCELCDMVFSSRFANIIHSSHHIIIPLIKQKIHKCKKCLYCFTSKSELKAHKHAKHKKKDVKENGNGQLGHEESQVNQELSQIGQEESQISYEKSEIVHKESQITIDRKKSATGKKKSQHSHKESHISRNDHKERHNSHNESQNKKDDLLQSIITKQPIVKIDNIAAIVVKSLLATKNNGKHSKIQKDTINFEKDSPIIQEKRKNIEKDEDITQNTKINESIKIKNANKQKNPAESEGFNIKKGNKRKNPAESESFNTKKGKKQKNPKENIYSKPQTSQNNITEELIPTKIIIGRKKSKSPDKTDYNESKRDKKATSTGSNKNKKDRNSEAEVTNGIQTTDLTRDFTNRQTFHYKEVSPDIISIKSDSSDEPKSDSITFEIGQSKRSLFDITHDEEGLAGKKNQSNTDQSKNLPQRDQSKNVPQKDSAKNVPQQNKSINIPFVITESDNELEANIDELLLLKNVISPVKKSNFRSKIQFEDDENIQLIDLERELTKLSYEFKSVHYDDLVEPELSECKRCHMIFMNRLSLYKHETTHIRFRRPRKHYFCKYCENYFYGNHFTQKKHYEQIHKTYVDKKKVFPCPVCKLQYYKLKEHYKKYHPKLFCEDCSTCFGSIQVFEQHNCSKSIQQNVFLDSKHTQKHYDLLLVCELCLSFTKTTGNFKYDVVGEKCEVGTRQRCFYCTKEFFDVKIVKRVNIMTSNRSQDWKNRDKTGSDGKKKVQGSNVVKLQMIQKRLKAMKK